MNVMLRASLLVLGLVIGLRARAASAADIHVSIAHTPASARIEQAIRWDDGPAGSRSLSVVLTNATDQDVSLERIEMELRWLSTVDPKLLLSAGGTTMGNWPMVVIDPSRPPNKPTQSGTYLMARHDGSHSLVGFLTWKTFWSKLRYENGRVLVTADGEGRVLGPGDTVALEKLWCAENPDWQDLLFGYADEIARELGLTLKPRPAFVGWSTWDYYGRDWTPGNVTDHLDAVRALAPSSNLLQIDGGWWPARGDYTLLRDSLQPDGMKALADAIRARGLTPGIHLDGMRGDLASLVAREHPEYFLKDERGALISVPETNDGDRLDHTYFDFSHPGALAYMREALRNIRRNWGYDYIKIDFLLYGIAEDIRWRAFKGNRARQIVAHDSALTSVERMHRALAAFREGMGEDAYFVACSAAFGPVFGHVDGLRTGPDIFPNFEIFKRCSAATAGAFYLHGRVVYNDADYQVGRSKQDEDSTLVRNPKKSGGDLTQNEAEMWAHYVGLFGGTKLNSDNLLILRPERKALFREAVALPSCARYVPLDFWSHARHRDDPFHVLLGEADGAVYLAVFNWSDEAREYTFTGLTPAEVHGVVTIAGKPTANVNESGFRTGLPARHSAIFKFSVGAQFDTLRQKIVVE